MNLRPAVVVNVALGLIVLALLIGETYILMLTEKLGSNRVAVGNTCAQDGRSAHIAKDGQHKDVYVNCSGFQG